MMTKIWIHFRNQQWRNGTLTIFFVFYPIILAFGLEAISYMNGRRPWSYSFVWHFPFLHLDRHFKFLRDLSKIEKTKCLLKKVMIQWNGKDEKHSWTVQEIEDKLLSVLAKEEVNLLMELWSERLDIEFDGNFLQEMDHLIEKAEAHYESKVSYFKIFEGYGESGCQLILQSSIWINDVLSDAKFGFSLKVITILTSFISLMMTVSSTYLSMPYIKRDEPDKAPFQNWLNHLVVMPIMMLVVIPRLINLAWLFASLTLWMACMTALGAFILYASTFLALTFSKYKKLSDGAANKDEYRRLWLLAFITSFFAPSIVIHPRCNMFYLSSLASFVGHVSVFMTMQLCLGNFMINENMVPVLECYSFLLPLLLILSLFLAWFLDLYSNEENALRTYLKPDSQYITLHSQI